MHIAKMCPYHPGRIQPGKSTVGKEGTNYAQKDLLQRSLTLCVQIAPVELAFRGRRH